MYVFVTADYKISILFGAASIAFFFSHSVLQLVL